MNTAQIELPPKLIPVFLGEARYRGAFGGRGSAKTRTFAKMTAVWALSFAQAGVSGIILCGRELVNSLDESSFAEVKAAIESEPDLLLPYFELGSTYIRTRDKRVEYAFAGLRHNLRSIKSKARILLCWVDEAEPVTEEGWTTLIPTVREEGELGGDDWESEIWVTWNPERKGSPTDKRFRIDPPPGAKIVQMNYKDNPWFPRVLERDRVLDLEKRPDSYAHIWDGDYVTAVEGAYYAKMLAQAKLDGRICRLNADPLFTIRLHCDIGGTGKKSDAFTIWADQYVGREIRVLDYYEAVGQPIGAHLEWLRSRGYTKGKAVIVLPHDGDNNDRVYDVSYRSAFEEAGYEVEVIPNQGTGAAKMRIEAGRRLFSNIWFDEARTEGGRAALGWYHEKIDQERGIGLGPDHDWSSHGADAFGLMCVAYEPPTKYDMAQVEVPGWAA